MLPNAARILEQLCHGETTFYGDLWDLVHDFSRHRSRVLAMGLDGAGKGPPESMELRGGRELSYGLRLSREGIDGDHAACHAERIDPVCELRRSSGLVAPGPARFTWSTRPASGCAGPAPSTSAPSSGGPIRNRHSVQHGRFGVQGVTGLHRASAVQPASRRREAGARTPDRPRKSPDGASGRDGP